MIVEMLARHSLTSKTTGISRVPAILNEIGSHGISVRLISVIFTGLKTRVQRIILLFV